MLRWAILVCFAVSRSWWKFGGELKISRGKLISGVLSRHETQGWGVSDLALPGTGFGRAGGVSFGGASAKLNAAAT